MIRGKPLLKALSLVALAAVACQAAEVVRCPVVKDVWVSAVGDEVNCSMGKTNRLKIKVWQETALMAFDLSAVKGRKVLSAELYVYPAGASGRVVAPQRGTDLRWLVLSTVSSRWVEGSQSASYKPDPEGHGATFLEASYRKKPWCWPGSDISYVVNGHLNSLACVGELKKAEGGYWKVPVDPRLVQALVAGLGDGLWIMDGSSSVGVNCYIYSREARGREPYLLVTLGEADSQPPAAPEIVSVKPDINHATPDAGALAITVKTPVDAVGFHVKVDGKLLEPWQVELPQRPGGTDTIVIEDLPPAKTVQVAVRAVDAAGNVSDWVTAEGQASDKVAVPALPAFPFRPRPGRPKPVGSDLVVWAFPEVTEVDPVTGLPVFEPNKAAFRLANPVWSGAEGRIRLAAARGEIVAFQLGLERTAVSRGKAVEATVQVSLAGPDGMALPQRNIRIYRLWYLKTKKGWQPEYAIPLKDGRVAVPSPDNAVTRQKHQGVYVDIYIPKDAAPGTYTGSVTVRTAGGSATLPLEVLVYPAVIPDELNFNPELNCYHGPGKAGSKEFFDYHRLAHYNRCTINRVPYSQNGKVHGDMIPKIVGKGGNKRVVDWSDYDRRIGPLLDGSAFKDNPRSGVPVKTFYLPFFENWPMPLEGHYQMGFPGMVGKPRDLVARAKEKHDLEVKPIEQAFDDEYKQGMVNVIRQFLQHYDEKGWTRTICEMYLNNKYNWGATWWTLDEPYEWTDWAALRFFSTLFHQAISIPHKAKFYFRGDISRPHWQGAWMDGLMEIMYVGGKGLGMPRLLRHIKERTGMTIYVYGSCNPVERDSFESAAWCLAAYSVYADGVLPWESLGAKKDPLRQPDQRGLLVSGKKFGLTAIPSIRVLALRHGAQLCELMRQVQSQRRWTRFHMGVLASKRVPLRSRFKQRFEDEAAAATFGRLTSEGFTQLKEALLQMLSQGQ